MQPNFDRRPDHRGFSAFPSSGSCATTLGLFYLTASAASAALVFVNVNQTNNIPPDGRAWATAYTRVQAAIDGAQSGDAVWVASGKYFENIKVKNGVSLYGGFKGTETDLGQRLWTKSPTILDGGQNAPVVAFDPGATEATRLDGFVIQHGKSAVGAGILCSNTSPLVINNLITHNNGPGVGAIYTSAPLITLNWILENSASIGDPTTRCGGIECFNSSPRIRNNRIIGNRTLGPFSSSSAGGIRCYASASPEISNNLIWGNSTPSTTSSAGGILILDSSAPHVINNTILWNRTAGPSGGGIWFNSTQAAPEVVNNILAFGSSGVFGRTNLVFKNNCVFGNGTNNFTGFPDPTGTYGNIGVDPGFAGSARYADIHLAAASACRDAGDTTWVQPDWLDFWGAPRVIGSAVDIGADEFDVAKAPFVPQIVRVSPFGDDAQDGSSWSAAKASVQTAINSAAFTGGEVWVQAGTYHERIAPSRFTYVYGGFAGNETARTQRDWSAFASILDGDRSGSVVVFDQVDQWSSLDGFVVQNGKAPAGAGIWCQGSSPQIVNNLIFSNAAGTATTPGLGGGLWLSNAAPMISNNWIRFNSAANGGGIFSGSYSDPVIANNRLEGNLAASFGIDPLGANGGGGILVYQNGKPAILDNLLVANVATNADSTTTSVGGAIACSAGTTPFICNNTLLSNLAYSFTTRLRDSGGGINLGLARGIVANNLIAFGSSGLQAQTAPYTNIANNCIFGNSTNYLIGPDLTGTNGNISLDPLLVDTSHLASTSPCIDAGDNTMAPAGSLDLDGQMRIAGLRVDIGADEYGSARPFTLFLSLQAEGPMLELSAETNRTYVFASSPDLINWDAFSTNLATESSLAVPAPPSNNSPGGFYRAAVLPP